MSRHMNKQSRFDIPKRPRRLRQSESIRELVEEVWVTPNDLIQPLFILPGKAESSEVSSMPGIFRKNLENTLKECEELLTLGVKAIAPFPQIDPVHKTENGCYALNEDCFLYEALRRIKKEFPELLIFSDLALDPYTTHGHDGVINKNGDVDNDATVEILGKMAVMTASTGVDFVAPSDMMDGRVGHIRSVLDQSGNEKTGILSYCVKYASAYYGPFRDAVGSKKSGSYVSKSSYQMNPASTMDILREVELDESEGADIIMVKPAGAYLDVIKMVSDNTLLPVAAYQVSGEYAQIYAAAQNGWLDLDDCIKESLIAIKRSGAQLILSYFSKYYAQNLFPYRK